MICRCRVCKKQIVGKLSNVYKHLSECHHIDVDTIHAAEKHICFHWNTDAPKNGIIIPDNLQELVKKHQYRKFFSGTVECKVCHKNTDRGAEFVLAERTIFNLCCDCFRTKIGAMIGDTIDVKDLGRNMNISIRIQQDVKAIDGLWIVTPSSPFGKSLLYKKIGDIVEVNAPKTKMKLQIISIR